MRSKITPIDRSDHGLELPRSPEASAEPVSRTKADIHAAAPVDVGTAFGGTIVGECVLVPEGEYEVRYLYYETTMYRGTPRVIVHFAIVGPDIYAGLPLERFLNVEELTGPPKKYGNFIPRRRGDLVREYGRIAGRTRRNDRLSFIPYKGLRIIGQVVTVTKDHRKDDLPDGEYYSKIYRLARVLPPE